MIPEFVLLVQVSPCYSCCCNNSASCRFSGNSLSFPGNRRPYLTMFIAISGVTSGIYHKHIRNIFLLC